jgi:predicted RNase H-like HicB family nuclease
MDFFVCRKKCIFVINYNIMEHIINLHIEKLPEGLYLATSEDIQGLVAQGRTIAETIEIARDVAKKLFEAKENEHQKDIKLMPVSKSFNYQLVVGF